MNGIGTASMTASSIGSEIANTSSLTVVLLHCVNSCFRVPQMANMGWHAKMVVKKKMMLQQETVATKVQLEMSNRRPINIRR